MPAKKNKDTDKKKSKSGGKAKAADRGPLEALGRLLDSTPPIHAAEDVVARDFDFFLSVSLFFLAGMTRTTP